MIDKEIAKGVTYSPDGSFGVKSKGGGGEEIYYNEDGSISVSGATTSSGGTVSGRTTPSSVTTKTGVGGSGGGAKTLSQLAIEYTNDLQLANKSLVAGKATKDDGTVVPFGGNEYKGAIMDAQKNRQVQLQNISNSFDELSASGVKKVAGKDLETLRTAARTKLQEVSISYNDFKDGNKVLVMGKGSLTDAAGNKIDKPIIELKNAVDVNKKDDYGQPTNIEVNGVYQPIYTSSDGTTRFVDVTDTNGDKVTYQADPKYGWLPVRTGPKTYALFEKIVKETDAALKTGGEFKPKLMGVDELNNFDFAQPAGEATVIKKEVKPGIMEQAKQFGSNVLNTAKAAVTPIQPDIVSPVVNAAVNAVKPNVPVVPTVPLQPGTMQPMINTGGQGTGTVLPQIKQSTLSIAGNVQKTPIQNLGTVIGPQKIQAPTPVTTPMKIATPQQLNLPTNLPLNPSKPVTTPTVTTKKNWWEFWK